MTTAHNVSMSVPLKLVRHTRYRLQAPDAHCIYCGATSGLTDEHILPAALYGHYELTQATCRDCQKIINESFLSGVLNRTFGSARGFLGLRRKGSKLRETVPVEVIGSWGAQPRVLQVPVDDAPAAIAFPQMKPPAFSSGISSTDLYTGKFHEVYLEPGPIVDQKFEAIRLSNGACMAQLMTRVSLSGFARFLCTIAHGFAYMQFGPQLQPFLPDIILGRSAPTTDVVGQAGFETHADGLHMIGLKEPPPQTPDTVWLLINLFCRYGTPVYAVAAGRVPTTAFSAPSYFQPVPGTMVEDEAAAHARKILGAMRSDDPKG